MCGCGRIQNVVSWGPVSMQKTVKKADLRNFSEIRENLSYWLSKTPEERLSALEHLRKTFHGTSGRLQRAARIAQRKKS